MDIKTPEQEVMIMKDYNCQPCKPVKGILFDLPAEEYVEQERQYEKCKECIRKTYPTCCVCGFNSKHGVFFGDEKPYGWTKKFACERCFMNPDLFFPAKKILLNGN